MPQHDERRHDTDSCLHGAIIERSKLNHEDDHYRPQYDGDSEHYNAD